MTRVERIGNCTLYLGDCRELIDSLDPFDTVLSDPPYGIEDMVGGYGRGGRTIANDTSLDACAAALSLCAQRLRHGWIAVFYSCRISELFFITMNQAAIDAAKAEGGERRMAYVGELIWDKKAPGMGKPIRYQ